ncbi:MULTISPECIES: MBL fold metallo-hydrolase [unclassified Brevundimonas]|uniref:MBL fold metallo-hydrolase n=1 Tax=unclassified Brevundimonas TaxID=2622653 RepID=UPI000E94D812|nr:MULTISPECIES: MBL fold metallo-hydrolase [unclassified Brevundimonas]MCK6105090.1 MBL fold metallo-hydrolase [Brevundimonas sp. EYE_349]HBI19655.1 MBL fold metallo-hydrolase [Brevundimonas sp.]
MADDGAAAVTRDARGLTYPFAGVPAPGEAVEVARGVLWLRFALPFQLDHVNAYALRDGAGWVVIDTGLRTPDTVAAWETALAGPLEGRRITRLICTHMHPDHIGLAGWLCERSGAPLWMSRLEYVTARMLMAEEAGDAPKDGVRFFRAAGWTEDQIEKWRGDYGGFAKGVAPMPRSHRRLSDGDAVRIGDDDWTVVIGSGHSPEHVCLWRRSDDVFLAGDQILPRISSNVSVWPTEPMADPLGDWMASLDRLRGIMPEGALILPAHGEPFCGVHARLEALKRGHETALKRLERTLRQPSRVIDGFPAVFGRTVGDGVLGMATGEAQAHLNYLEKRGRARRTRDENGVDWWTAVEQDEETT